MRTVTNEAQALLQAGFTTVAVVAVLSATAVDPPATSRVLPPDPDEGAVVDVGAPLWREGWSERFPGCVAMVLWPQGERPVALVTRSPDGGVHRVPVGSDRRVPLGDRAVGACR
jgi:hypothetical protein